ncbi:MAG: tRNA threonylcarbamoyladenosine dehydratase [Desulfocapsaceae bacterium]
MLLGPESFKRLSQSHVTVIGLGAVGGYALEALARTGIGRLTVVDFDTIQPTNINRQILAMESTMGCSKVAAAADRIRDINPSCRIEPLELFIDDITVEEVFSRSPDIIVDAIDSMNPKVQLLRACYHSGIPTFSSMGAALRTDPLAIRTGDLSESNHCPLAKRIRKRLRKDNIVSGITCVYSTEKVDFDYHQEIEPTQIEAGMDRGRKRNTLGSLPTITAIFGLVLANEIIRVLSTKP